MWYNRVLYTAARGFGYVLYRFKAACAFTQMSIICSRLSGAHQSADSLKLVALLTAHGDVTFRSLRPL